MPIFNSSLLGASNVLVDSRDNPKIVSIHLRHSKNDSFGNGVTVCVWAERTNASAQ